MFGKHKKQKSKTPIEEMEQFYLNQFLNNTKNPPQDAIVQELGLRK